MPEFVDSICKGGWWFINLMIKREEEAESEGKRLKKGEREGLLEGSLQS